MRIVSLLPSTTEILFDLGAGDDVVGVTFECDHPAEARQPHDRVDQRDARGTGARGDRRVRRRRRCAAARTSTTSTRARCPASTPTWWSPRTSARSARSTSPWSTTRWPTSAAPPRCSPSTRTPSRRCSPPSSTLGKATGHRGAAPPRWSPRCATRLDDVVGAGGRPRPRRGRCSWSGPTRRSRRVTGCRRWSTSAGGESVLGTPGEKSFRATWDDVRGGRPGGRGVRARAATACEQSADAGRGRWSRAGVLPADVRGLGGRRQRVVRPARPPAGRRRRGAGRDPAPRRRGGVPDRRAGALTRLSRAGDQVGRAGPGG